MYDVILVLTAVLFILKLARSPTFVFFAKHFLYYFTLFFLSGLAIPLLMVRPRDAKTIRLVNRVFGSYLLPALGLSYRIYGSDKLLLTGPCLVVANHQHEIDIIALMQLQPSMGKYYTVAKKQILFTTGCFGLFSWLCGCFYVNRSNTIKDRQVLDRVPAILKEEQAKMVVFPEGTRRNTGVIHPFKKGAFHVAVQAQLPIVPVVVSHYYFLSSKKCRWSSGEVILSVLDPVPTEGLTAEAVTALCSRVQQDMENEFMRIDRLLPGIHPYTKFV